MKILFRSHNFTGKRNAHIHQGFFDALAKVAEVKFSGKGFDGTRDNTLKELLERYEKPDVVVFYTLDKGWTYEANKVKGIFKVLIACDKSRNWERIQAWNESHDVNLIATKKPAPELEDKLHIPTESLLHSIDPTIFKDYGLEKKYDTSFFGEFKAGAYTDRKKYCEAIVKWKKYKYKFGGRDCPGAEDVGFVPVNDVAKIYNQTKICFVNPSMRQFLLSRYFEVPACKAMLLCQNTLGLQDAFEKDKHYIMFENLGDFREKLDYYLEHDDERQKITDAGHKHVMSYHTHEIRAKQFVEMIKKYL